MRTVNRPPMSVNIPDIEYKYFNHCNWKGLNTNENYYDLDPETFESAENVYVDEKGILKSRPSVHLLATDGLENIIKSWSFGNTQVYLTDDYWLHFYSENKQLSKELESKSTLPIITRNKNKLFIFDGANFKYYDIDNNNYDDATEHIYIPITKRITNGVIANDESQNLLTNKERHEYVYGPKSTVDFTQLYNYKVTIKTDDYAKTIDKFSDVDKDLIFFKRHDQLDNFYHTLFSAPPGHDSFNTQSDIIQYKPYRPLISVSDVNTYIFCKAEKIYSNNFVTFNYKVYYSLDGIILTELPSLPDGVICVVEPKISLNGKYVCALTTNGIYCLSLSKDEDVYKYPTWQLVYRLEDTIPYHSVGTNYGNVNIIANALFFTDIDFVIVYGNDISDSPDRYTHCVAGQLNVLCKNGGDVKPYIVATSNNDKIVPIRPHISGKLHDNGISYAVHYHDGSVTNFSNELLLKYGNDRYTSIANEFAVLFKNNTMYIFQGNDIYSYTYGATTSTFVRNAKYMPYAYNSFNYESKLISSLYEPVGDNITDPSNDFLYSQDFLSNDYTTFDHTTYDLPLDYSYPHNYVIGITDNLHIAMSNTLYNTVLDKNISLYKFVTGKTSNLKISLLALADTYYAAHDNKLYIAVNRYDDDNEFEWYFPKDNVEAFSENISALHSISNTQIGIFLKDEIWYTVLTEDGISLEKSKIRLGCNVGDEVITSYDGKYTIFPSKRGLVALSYQDFVASTEQIITYLSDNILSEFVEFVDRGPVKLFLHKYWLFCYQNISNQMYLFDFRNNAWWVWRLPYEVDSVIEINNTPELIINKKRASFDYRDTDYFDYLGDDRITIKWHLTSQKLNLGTLNNYKHVVNLTLNALQVSDSPMYLTLSLANYRDTATKVDGKVLEYQVDVLKTFVKRLNYYKINYFQYKLENTDNIAIQIPLSIDNISIKYKITGQVR